MVRSFGNWKQRHFLVFLEERKNKFAIFFLENYSVIAEESQVQY